MKTRLLEGAEYERVLRELAIISAAALSLRQDLRPLSIEDLQAGAEPITAEQISEELSRICNLVAGIAIMHLHASPEEWLAVTEAIE